MCLTGSWSEPLGPGKQPSASTLSSSRHEGRETLRYSKKDIEQIEKWGMLTQILIFPLDCSYSFTVKRHVETTWHSLGTCSMAPREGSSIAPHGGVVDERLNVHGVKGLKVCDLSICPDNVGCNTFSVSYFTSLTRLWLY